MISTPLRLALVTGLAVGSLAACGGTDDTDDAAAPQANASVTATLSASQAEAIATASLLVAADLPGYKATPADETPDPDADKAEAELEKCVGVSQPDYLAEATSDDFSKGEPPAGVEISSDVSVVKTEAEGQADLEAFLSDKALACFEDFLGSALQDAESQGLTVGAPKVERFDVKAPTGASAAFGLRVASELSAAGQSFSFSIDLLGALVQRAELTVSSVAFGEPLARTEQERLLGLMVSRAVTAQTT